VALSGKPDNKAPSAALAAVIGTEPVARPAAVKKLWEYIKTHNLQDPQDKRSIVADDKLRAVFGKERAGMFELAGLLGPQALATTVAAPWLGGKALFSDAGRRYLTRGLMDVSPELERRLMQSGAGLLGLPAIVAAGRQ